MGINLLISTMLKSEKVLCYCDYTDSNNYWNIWRYSLWQAKSYKLQDLPLSDRMVHVSKMIWINFLSHHGNDDNFSCHRISSIMGILHKIKYLNIYIYISYIKTNKQAGEVAQEFIVVIALLGDISLIASTWWSGSQLA